MLTNRRRSEGSSARPESSLRQEKAGCWPCSTFSSASAMRGDRRLDVFERRFFEPNAFERLRDGAEDPAQSRIEGERSEERLRLDQLIHVLTHVVDAEEQDSVAGEEFAAVRPADGADHIRLRRQRLDQRIRRLVGRLPGSSRR